MANGKKGSARQRYRLRRAMLAPVEPEYETSSALPEVPEIDPAEFASLQEKTAALGEENTQLRDLALRQKAEFDNFRRRTLKEKDQIREASKEDILVKLLPVVDNFDRAVEAAATTTDAAPLREGVQMVADQLRRILESDGLARIDAMNQPFNPEEHEALAMEERTDIPDNHVSFVMLPGYRFREKVVRPAMVKVARAPQGQGAEAGASDGQEDGGGDTAQT